MATVTQPTQTSDVRGNAGLLSSYLFLQGIHKPEFSQFLTYKYPQYVLTSLMDRLDRYEPSKQDTFSWSELPRTREVGTVADDGAAAPDVTDNGGGSFTVVTDETQLYFVARDVGRLHNEDKFIVTAASLVGGKQSITLRSVDDSAPLTAGDFAIGDKLSHLYNLHEEYSNQPDPRAYLGETVENQLNILRRTSRYSTTEFTNATWVSIGGKNYWYFQDEMIAMAEFARDRENCLMFGTTASVATLGSLAGGKGIIDFVEEGGVAGTFPATVVESDIMDMIQALKVSSPASEYLVLAGSKFLKDATIALRDYHVGGGISYGVFNNVNTIGLKLQQYEFLATTVTFVHYPPFDDPKMLPTKTGQIDYSNYSLWLNMGNDNNGEPLIKIKYKEDANGVQYKFIKKISPGMSSPTADGNDGIAVTGRDGFDVHLYSYIGLEFRAKNNHGILRAA